ncbi:hypothetical protein QYF36_025790 [Acer negundo]|nr:hypothetical protein QYF36_025790 [Acer negundo]
MKIASTELRASKVKASGGSKFSSGIIINDSRSNSKKMRTAASVMDSSPIRRPSLAYSEVKSNQQVCDFLCSGYGHAKTPHDQLPKVLMIHSSSP